MRVDVLLDVSSSVYTFVVVELRCCCVGCVRCEATTTDGGVAAADDDDNLRCRPVDVSRRLSLAAARLQLSDAGVSCGAGGGGGGGVPKKDFFFIRRGAGAAVERGRGEEDTTCVGDVLFPRRRWVRGLGGDAAAEATAKAKELTLHRRPLLVLSSVTPDECDWARAGTQRTPWHDAAASGTPPPAAASAEEAAAAAAARDYVGLTPAALALRGRGEAFLTAEGAVPAGAEQRAVLEAAAAGGLLATVRWALAAVPSPLPDGLDALALFAAPAVLQHAGRRGRLRWPEAAAAADGGSAAFVGTVRLLSTTAQVAHTALRHCPGGVLTPAVVDAAAYRAACAGNGDLLAVLLDDARVRLTLRGASTLPLLGLAAARLPSGYGWLVKRMLRAGLYGGPSPAALVAGAAPHGCAALHVVREAVRCRDAAAGAPDELAAQAAAAGLPEGVRRTLLLAGSGGGGGGGGGGAVEARLVIARPRGLRAARAVGVFLHPGFAAAEQRSRRRRRRRGQQAASPSPSPLTEAAEVCGLVLTSRHPALAPQLLPPARRTAFRPQLLTRCRPPGAELEESHTPAPGTLSTRYTSAASHLCPDVDYAVVEAAAAAAAAAASGAASPPAPPPCGALDLPPRVWWCVFSFAAAEAAAALLLTSRHIAHAAVYADPTACAAALSDAAAAAADGGGGGAGSEALRGSLLRVSPHPYLAHVAACLGAASLPLPTALRLLRRRFDAVEWRGRHHCLATALLAARWDAASLELPAAAAGVSDAVVRRLERAGGAAAPAAPPPNKRRRLLQAHPLEGATLPYLGHATWRREEGGAAVAVTVSRSLLGIALRMGDAGLLRRVLRCCGFYSAERFVVEGGCVASPLSPRSPRSPRSPQSPSAGKQQGPPPLPASPRSPARRREGGGGGGGGGVTFALPEEQQEGSVRRWHGRREEAGSSAAVEGSAVLLPVRVFYSDVRGGSPLYHCVAARQLGLLEAVVREAGGSVPRAAEGFPHAATARKVWGRGGGGGGGGGAGDESFTRVAFAVLCCGASEVVKKGGLLVRDFVEQSSSGGGGGGGGDDGEKEEENNVGQEEEEEAVARRLQVSRLQALVWCAVRSTRARGGSGGGGGGSGEEGEEGVLVALASSLGLAASAQEVREAACASADVLLAAARAGVLPGLLAGLRAAAAAAVPAAAVAAHLMRVAVASSAWGAAEALLPAVVVEAEVETARRRRWRRRVLEGVLLSADWGGEEADGELRRWAEEATGALVEGRGEGYSESEEEEEEEDDGEPLPFAAAEAAMALTSCQVATGTLVVSGGGCEDEDEDEDEAEEADCGDGAEAPWQRRLRRATRCTLTLPTPACVALHDACPAGSLYRALGENARGVVCARLPALLPASAALVRRRRRRRVAAGDDEAAEAAAAAAEDDDDGVLADIVEAVTTGEGRGTVPSWAAVSVENLLHYAARARAAVAAGGATAAARPPVLLLTRTVHFEGTDAAAALCSRCYVFKAGPGARLRRGVGVGGCYRPVPFAQRILSAAEDEELAKAAAQDPTHRAASRYLRALAAPAPCEEGEAGGGADDGDEGRCGLAARVRPGRRGAAGRWHAWTLFLSAAGPPGERRRYGLSWALPYEAGGAAGRRRRRRCRGFGEAVCVGVEGGRRSGWPASSSESSQHPAPPPPLPPPPAGSLAYEVVYETVLHTHTVWRAACDLPLSADLFEPRLVSILAAHVRGQEGGRTGGARRRGTEEAGVEEEEEDAAFGLGDEGEAGEEEEEEEDEDEWEDEGEEGGVVSRARFGGVASVTPLVVLKLPSFTAASRSALGEYLLEQAAARAQGSQCSFSEFVS